MIHWGAFAVLRVLNVLGAPAQYFKCDSNIHVLLPFCRIQSVVTHHCFTDATTGFWQNVLYCCALQSCASPATLLCGGNSGPTLMSYLAVGVSCWQEMEEQNYSTILLTASWYYGFAVKWNWILSQSNCLWDYAPALAIKVRLLQAGRIWCSVKSDATGSPIWVLLNKLELSMWQIPVHVAVVFLQLP